MTFTAVSGLQDHEPIIISDQCNQQWRLVSVNGNICTFEAVEHREIGYAPRTKEIALLTVQKLYGWEPKRDHHLATAPDGFGQVVVCDDRAKGYAIAEPIWYKLSDDDLALESARLYQELTTFESRNCDRAGSFGRF